MSEQVPVRAIISCHHDPALQRVRERPLNKKEQASRARNAAAVEKRRRLRQARAALAKSDAALMLILETVLPPDWQQYRADLRAVIAGDLVDLPDAPADPMTDARS